MEKRRRLDFTDDGATWTITLVEKEVDLVVRLFRLKKRKPKFKPLETAELIAFPISTFQLPSEKFFYENARYSFRIARRLYSRGDFRDAYLYLHLALEQVLKLLIIKTKYAYQKHYHDSPPPASDPKGKGPNLSHDVGFIIHYLIGIVTDLSASVKIGGVLSGNAIRKTYGDWASDRYLTNPNDPISNADFKWDYEQLRKGFIPFIVDLRDKGMLK